MINYSDDRKDFVQAVDQQGNFSAGIVSSSTERDYREFSPMAAIILNPIEDVSLFGNLSTAFAPPSTQTPGDLDAEESTQFEVGVKANALAGKLDFSATYFDINKENIALATASGIPNQVGSQKASGVEIEAAFRPGYNLSFQGNFTFTSSELTEFGELLPTGNPQFPFFPLDYSGNNPAFAPEQMATFWASKTFDAGVNIGAGLRYYGEQYIAPDNLYLVDAALFSGCQYLLHLQSGSGRGEF